MDKKLNKFLTIFLLFQPILDVITSIQIRNNIGFISISAIVRGLFFLYVIFYLYKHNVKKKVLFLFLVYVFLAMSYYFLYTKNNYIVELLNLMKIFYLPFLIYFFTSIDNENINDKLILIIYLLFINLIIIPYIFNIGFDIYKDFEHKSGFIGLFYSGNEISAILIGLMPIVFNYILYLKNYIIKIFTLIETIIIILLVGTKSLYFGFIIISIYFLLKYLTSKNITKKSKVIHIILLILLIIISIMILPKTSMYKNLNEAIKFYEINEVKDVFTLENIDNIVFSKRLSYASKVNDIYVKGDFKVILYGIGLSAFPMVIELDIFDIFYSIGLFGSIVYVVLLIDIKQKLKSEYKLSLILFILLSLTSGHVLLEPMVSIYIALLFALSKNKKELNKKRILLVSNMYPNNKYKFYGSFVKNTENILLNNNFIVDKSVKYKETRKLGKLISYIALYTKTFLKLLFNNYDYVYVHFSSHSCVGTIIPLKTTKDLKLVINVHGNDIVKDYDFEEKNEKRSRKYLKYAYKIIAPSNYYKDVLIDKYDIDEEKIVVYPSGGVNTDKFKKMDIKQAKKEANLSEEYEYIGYISRIEKNKGYDVFLRMIRELEIRNEIGNKRFLIIGTGDEEEKMLKLIKELDITKYLEIRNMVSQDELVSIYNSLEIFVFPTYRESESLGLVGLEAMACETFLIASNNYGPTDYVVDNKNGFMFNPKDEKDLADKILGYYKLNNEQKKKIFKKERETAIRYDSKNTEGILINTFKE